MAGRVRRAGGRWRLLVHEALPRGASGDAHHIASERRREDSVIEHDGDEFWSRTYEFPGTEFDELVVGRWIHIEQMDTGFWWMNIGGVTVHVKADRDGRPTHVVVHGPGDYTAPVEGCTYEVVWSGLSSERAS
jgi:hypothetical protein